MHRGSPVKNGDFPLPCYPPQNKQFPPWKWMVGRRYCPFWGRPVFRALAVSFRECSFRWCILYRWFILVAENPENFKNTEFSLMFTYRNHSITLNMIVTLFVCLFVCLLACLFVCLFVCLLACLFVCLFACLFVCLFVCLFLFHQHFNGEQSV